MSGIAARRNLSIQYKVSRLLSIIDLEPPRKVLSKTKTHWVSYYINKILKPL